MATAIDQAVDALPADGFTVRALKALDYVAPGQWQNITGWDVTVAAVTGETDLGVLNQVKQRAIELYNNPSEGYQRALWIYQTVDATDKTLGMAAMANKVGEKIPFLGFLSKITPKADKTQAFDLGVKLVGEVAAFCYTNGLPGDSIGDFVAALASYENDSLIRMAALITFDGLIPLGPDFMRTVLDRVGQGGTGDLTQNATFQRIKDLIPGGGDNDKLGFISTSLQSVSGWAGNFIAERGITRENAIQSLRQYVEIGDDKLDYLAGFLDLSTDYMAHTGTQSVARSLISRAVSEI
ncbi:MAG: hypothetical protein H8F28_04385 [Fibrella sp.]|nr:hypothetical protein [Armatimonadota bacterium]